MEVIAFLTERKVVKAVLDHLGLPSTEPPVARARAGPQEAFEQWQDDVPEMQ